MNNALSKLLLTVVILTGSAALAIGQDKEGGDPEAIVFVQIGRNVQRWLRTEQKRYYEVNQAHLAVVLDRIESSLSQRGQRPLLEFVEHRPVDKAGVEKLAVFDVSLGDVHVHLKSWLELDQAKRYELVSLELLGLIDYKDRYAFVREQIVPNVEAIRTVALNDFDALRGDFLQAKNSGYDALNPSEKDALARWTTTVVAQYTDQLINQLAPTGNLRKVAIQSRPQVPHWARFADISATTYVKYRYTSQPASAPLNAFGDITCRIETHLGTMGLLPITFQTACAQDGVTDHREFQAVGMVCQDIRSLVINGPVGKLQLIHQGIDLTSDELARAISSCPELKN